MCQFSVFMHKNVLSMPHDITFRENISYNQLQMNVIIQERNKGLLIVSYSSLILMIAT